MPLLEIKQPNYRRLGLEANPFPAVPTYSEYGNDFFSETYAKKELGLLRKILTQNCRSDSSRMAIYLFGDLGCGKSTVFGNFVRKHSSNKYFLPIYCRFPFYGGLSGLYHELVKRIDPLLLRKLATIVRTKYPFWPPSYFLRKARNASFSQTEWDMVATLRISAYYAVEAFRDLISNLLQASKRKKIVMFLDDLEHTWFRLTGPQRYRWEETLAKIIPRLKRKLVFVLPINPKILTYSYSESRPYFGMYDWVGINLDDYIGFRPEAAVIMQKNDDDVLALALELIDNTVNSKKGKQFCRSLVNDLSRPLGSASEVLQGLYFETRRAAQRF